MLTTIVVVLTGLGIAEAPRSAGASDAVWLARTTADRICSCPDTACAQAAMERYTKRAAEMMKSIRPEDVTSRDMELVKQATERWMACQTALTSRVSLAELASQTADAACKCSDERCVDGVLGRYAVQSAAMMKRMTPRDLRGSDLRRIGEATERWTMCKRLSDARTAVDLADETAGLICACADTRCTQTAMEVYTARAAELMRHVRPEDVTMRDMQAVKVATDRWMKCQTDLMVRQERR